jgi:hypothetical protein
MEGANRLRAILLTRRRQSRETDDGWSPAGLRGHGATGVAAPAFERTELKQSAACHGAHLPSGPVASLQQ